MVAEQKMVLHGFRLSGHSHRAELMLNLLALPYEFRHVDLAAGAQRHPDFLRINPFGTVPVLEDGDFIIPDSAAILVYLALKYDDDRLWLPRDIQSATQVHYWLSMAQGPVLNGPAKARMVRQFGKRFNYAEAVGVTQELLAVLDAHLRDRAFLVGEAATLADIAVYSYVARSPEGGVPHDGHEELQAWLRRVESLPRFLSMPNIP